MINVLQKWPGSVSINGHSLDEFKAMLGSSPESFSGPIHIILSPVQQKRQETTPDKQQITNRSSNELRITVKQYMTRKATPEFDFMERWNSNNPMPLRTMVGTIEKETRGMVYMKLHGQAESVIHCMRCGRPLTNPISQHYGIGPECMAKLGFVCDIDDISTIKKKLVEVTWEGWVIRSAITHWEEL